MSESGTSPTSRVNAPTAALLRLAALCGIQAEYSAWNGERRTSSARAIRAVLGAMGIEAEDDSACQKAADRLLAEKRARPLPPVTVMREGEGADLVINAPRGTDAEVTLTLETGFSMELARVRIEEDEDADALRPTSRLIFRLPSHAPVGYHTVTAHVGQAPASATGRLMVAPARIPFPHHLRAPRPWGFLTQLYSVRSRASWGMGDLADLRDLCTLAATRAGADFVLVNPLHAGEPLPPLTPSPYLPASRLFVHPIYIRPEDIPEVAYMPGADRSLIDWSAEKPHASSLSPSLIDRDAIWAAKKEVLEQVFALPRTAARQAAFDAYRASQGTALGDFATWCALVEQAAHDEAGRFPAELSSPSGSGVGAFRSDHRARIEFYEWLQWVADEQRAVAQDAARRAGMRIGVMTDLAVGVHPTGADAWALGAALARGVGVGAPPDMYNQQGQDWSQPPWLPRGLEDARYEPFRAVVRASLRHAGALRIDHILGMFRLWWVPDGLGADDGAYVTYDHEAMFAVLTIEATRAGAVVIGEDLGTVEPWVVDYLSSRGVLGTTVSWFEWEGDRPRPPEHQRSDVLATVTTHDLPPTAAYLAGEHVHLREKLGLLARPVEDVRAEAEAERAAMVAMLVERGWARPAPGGGEPDGEAILLGMHRAIFAAPALLVGVALTDAVREMRTQNQPGTDREYPNWCVPLGDGRGLPVLLDQLFDHPSMRSLLAVIREEAP